MVHTQAQSGALPEPATIFWSRPMHFAFRDTNATLVELAKLIGRDTFEEVEQCSIVSKTATAVVSPANSFGFMDGGVDLVYTTFFGSQVQESLQSDIQEFCIDQELNVGRALSVATGNAIIPWLIAAPTMRVPRIIEDYLDVYLAARAAAIVALDLLPQDSLVAFPGMGTGAGCVPPAIALRAMVRGIQDARNPAPFPKTLGEAGRMDYAVRHAVLGGL